jgi:hypothetical protein
MKKQLFSVLEELKLPSIIHTRLGLKNMKVLRTKKKTG